MPMLYCIRQLTKLKGQKQTRSNFKFCFVSLLYIQLVRVNNKKFELIAARFNG